MVVAECFGFVLSVVFSAEQVALLHIECVGEVLYASGRSSGRHPESGVAVGARQCAGSGFDGLPQGVFFGEFPDACGIIQFYLRIVSVGIHKILRADGAVL